MKNRTPRLLFAVSLVVLLFPAAHASAQCSAVLTASKLSIPQGSVSGLTIKTGGGAWTLESALKAKLSKVSGVGGPMTAYSTYTGTVVGRDVVTLRNNACRGVASVTIDVLPSPPKVTFTAYGYARVEMGASAVLTATITNSPDTNETSYVVNSSRQNSITPTVGFGAGVRTFTFTRDASRYDDMVCITAMNAVGSATACWVFMSLGD